MISPQHIRELAENKLQDSSSYLVDVTVSAANKIRVIIDNFEGIAIKECVSMSRWIEGQLDRENEDFELEVTSPGLDQPFKVNKQYEKNIGREVDVVLADGQKITGKLVALENDTVEIEQESKEKVDGKKGKQLVMRKFSLPLTDIKETRIVIKF
jgi:ribosome maturation factor RimP